MTAQGEGGVVAQPVMSRNSASEARASSIGYQARHTKG